MEKLMDQELTQFKQLEIYGSKRKVDIVKGQAMEHLEGVEEARYYVEQIQKEIDLTDVGIQLDAMAEQNNADCQGEIISQHPDYQHLDPEHVADERPTTASMYAKI